MVLTLTTTHAPATDLGYLLHKNPARLHSASLSFGQAWLAFPEQTAERCTAAVVVEVDPVGLVRGGARFDQYVNDRPYSASSFLSVALKALFSTAMAGRCKERPDLAQEAIPLEARLACVPSRGGDGLLRGLFEPLGYAVETARIPLDPEFPDWGESRLFDLKLCGVTTLQRLLNHLYVLVPVLDGDKHYWLDPSEVEKLLRAGEGWLADHPWRDQITRGYLQRCPGLAREALARLWTLDDSAPDEAEGEPEGDSPSVPQPLHDQRLASALEVLKGVGARKVLDVGCGEGKLLSLLLQEKSFTEIVGMDVSLMALERAERRLRLDRLPASQAARVKLLHGSLLYRDRRLEGYDAAAVVEVVEHLDPERLAAFERCLFEFARPATVVVTTPNADYNAVFGMSEGELRHADHRFEWTRAGFQDWCERVASTHGYQAEVHLIGPVDAAHGAPSQMGVFKR